MTTTDPWMRLAMAGQLRLTARFPGAGLAALHAVARARLAVLRARMLAPDPMLDDLAAAIERRDAAAREWAGREALLAVGQNELRQIQAEFHAADQAGVLDALGWDGHRAAPVSIRGSALGRWQMAAAARLQRLIPAVLALEEARPALLALREIARASRIAALTDTLTRQSGLAWHRVPVPEDSEMPPPLRAASLEAHGAPGQSLSLHWRHDSANGMEWLRWRSCAGRDRQDGSVAGRPAVLATLRPLALAA